jgi:predicted dehydrogenase
MSQRFSSHLRRPLRGIFLGTGHFAPIQLSGWRDVTGAEIAGIYGRRASAAQELATRHAIGRHSDDLKALIESVRPDFADICTAVEVHAEHIRICAEAGLPILCQKPIAPTAEDARTCVETCQAAGVPMMVNDNWRWQPWYREIRRILDAGTLGAVISVYHTLRTGDGIGPQAYAAQPYFRTMPRFLLLETGIHYLDTYRFLFGEPNLLSCQIRRCNPAIAGEDAALLTLQFPSGISVTWDANRATPTERQKPPFNGTMRIEGSRGILDVDSDGRMTITRTGAAPVEHGYTIPKGYRGGSVAAALQHFVDRLHDNAPFETSGLDYLRTTRLVFAAYEAAETGHTRSLE